MTENMVIEWLRSATAQQLEAALIQGLTILRAGVSNPLETAAIELAIQLIQRLAPKAAQADS